MKFNLATAISTGVQAFTKTGNPWVAVGAAAAGGLAGRAASGSADPLPRSGTSGDVIGGLLGHPNGTDPLKALAERKKTDWAGLLA